MEKQNASEKFYQSLASISRENFDETSLQRYLSVLGKFLHLNHSNFYIMFTQFIIPTTSIVNDSQRVPK